MEELEIELTEKQLEEINCIPVEIIAHSSEVTLVMQYRLNDGRISGVCIDKSDAPNAIKVDL